MNNSRKFKEYDIVEFRHNDILFMITRFRRINWREYNGFAQYQYFVYILDNTFKVISEENGQEDVFNIMVYNNVYPTFEDLTSNIGAILSEYILEDEVAFECLKRIEHLHPIYKNRNKE
ncbi:hypothetical protein [Salinibacillus kushneri]|nr:hypothetical protein [Salinibacillus kushneri]